MTLPRSTMRDPPDHIKVDHDGFADFGVWRLKFDPSCPRCWIDSTQEATLRAVGERLDALLASFNPLFSSERNLTEFRIALEQVVAALKRSEMPDIEGLKL